jgi:hypothetical protein
VNPERTAWLLLLKPHRLDFVAQTETTRAGQETPQGLQQEAMGGQDREFLA